MQQTQYATITIHVTAENITDDALADIVGDLITDIHESANSPLEITKIVAQKTAELYL
jgi:hypothetical protein